MSMAPMSMPPMASGPAPAPGDPGMNMGGGGVMLMTFFWGKDVTLLFDSWRTKNLAQYLFTLVAIFIFAMLHQWLSGFRSYLSALSEGKASPSRSQNLELAGRPNVQSRVSPQAMRLLLSLLFGLNAATGYLLMLLVMSYNGGVFIVVVLGLLVAHFIFQGIPLPGPLEDDV